MNFKEFQSSFQQDEVIEQENEVLESCPNPVVSVIICTFEQKDFIRQAIEGVLMQKTDFSFELIIGDDESSDGTRGICVEYAKSYPNLIRLFLHNRKNNILINGKPTVTFQYLYNCYTARGKYIAGVAGDDYWTDPEKLQKQYNFLKKNPKFSASCHNFYIREELDTLPDYEVSKSYRIYYPDAVIQQSRRPLTMMYRNIFTSIPIQFAEVLAEDVFLRFILETIGPIIHQSEIDGAVYRLHKSSVWNSSTTEFKLNDSVLTYRKIYQAYLGTPYKKMAAVLLIHSLVRKQLYISKNRKENKFLMLINLKEEINNNKIGLMYFFSYIIWETKVKIKLHVSRIFKSVSPK